MTGGPRDIQLKEVFLNIHATYFSRVSRLYVESSEVNILLHQMFIKIIDRHY